ncbi:predicted protein [Ostreococcus lucimarinus CCE9901]|uniref:Uncharacterized protein n=1 Tax=Ostreococcus lucimarinus (strain CCE9901) TaxID=436017 RepID=A4RRA5_OSTLU|nr:predicted protein [Ostreococcus lucimarinus CCE9901]ABO93830.1 predicted protein [Ostreococcus lucimarinus CCE9901]|eukprot:XP_001415538.1 predicted protein [Ostreococcus lucimarinus CCE9901]
MRAAATTTMLGRSTTTGARARARAAPARASTRKYPVVSRFSATRDARTGAGAFRNAPEPQTEEEEGSVLDFPEEYQRAVPSRRPDIFPDLKEPKTPMPRPMPGDPEMPDEEEEEKERKENPGEPGEKPEDEEEEENEKKKKKKIKKDDEEEE